MKLGTSRKGGAFLLCEGSSPGENTSGSYSFLFTKLHKFSQFLLAKTVENLYTVK